MAGKTLEVLLGRVVDWLPRRWWRPLNMYIGGRLHFCVGDGVRTVEWNGRVLASGHRPFPQNWFQAKLASSTGTNE